MNAANKIAKRQQEHLAHIKQFCLMDDEFFAKCFENNIECTELVLKIILAKPDLQVNEAKTQFFITNLLKRSVRLDVLATDSQGSKYNIEIQKANSGAGYKRARFYSSILDANLLQKGEDFSALPETYVIFLTEKDFVGQGRPLYPIERCNLVTGEIIPDDEHIIYVNGSYRDNSALGRLMQDFANKEPDKMNYDLLADRVRFFKTSKEGVAIMSNIVEEIWNQGKQEGIEEGIELGKEMGIEKGIELGKEMGIEKGIEKGIEQGKQEGKQENSRENATRMLNAGKLSLEEIVEYSGLSLAEVKKLQSGQSA